MLTIERADGVIRVSFREGYACCTQIIIEETKVGLTLNLLYFDDGKEVFVGRTFIDGNGPLDILDNLTINNDGLLVHSYPNGRRWVIELDYE